MRRFAIAAFALLYAVSVFSLTAERCSWATRQVSTSHATSGERSSDKLGKIEKSDTHISQTKIFESGFVGESPREATAILIQSGRLAVPQSDDFRSTWNSQPSSSRAPPSLL